MNQENLSTSAVKLYTNLTAILTQSQSKKEAEKFLAEAVYQEGISQIAQEIVHAPGCDAAVVQLLFIILKNTCAQKENRISLKDEESFRKISLTILFSGDKNRSFRESVIAFLQASYRKEKEAQWGKVIEDVLPFIQGGVDSQSIHAKISALKVINMIVKLNWNRYISFSEDDEEPRDKKKQYNDFNSSVWDNAFPLVHDLLRSILDAFYSTDGIFSRDILRDQNILCLATQREFWELLHFIVKLFWSSAVNDIHTYASLGSSHGSHGKFQEWLRSILQLAQLPLDVSMALQSTGNTQQMIFDVSENAAQWKVLKWVFTFLSAFINSADRKDTHSLNATSFPGKNIAELLHRACTSRLQGVFLSRKAFVVALNCMEHIILRKKFECISLGPGFFEKIIDATFNELKFTEADGELLNDSPMEFLEQNIEVCYDTYDPRSSAYRLLKSLLTLKLIKKTTIPSTFFMKVKAGIETFDHKNGDLQDREKYAYACVIYRLSSILKKNVSPVTIYTDFIRPFLRDISRQETPYLQFIALQIVQTYTKLLKNLSQVDNINPIEAIVNEITKQLLMEHIGVNERVAIQVQLLRCLSTLIGADFKRCAPLVEPNLLKIMDIALRLLQLDCGVQSIVLDAVAIFIEHFPTQLDPVLTQLCSHFIQHVYSILGRSAELRSKTATEKKSTSILSTAKEDTFDDAEFTQEDSLNSALESTLRTLYTIVATMVQSSKWHVDLQRTVCPFLRELLSQQDDSSLCLMESRELMFDIFDVISTNVETYTSESWDLLQLAYQVVTTEDDQFFVCECGSKIFDITKEFVSSDPREFFSRGLQQPMFEICNIFLNPTVDDEVNFFDESDRMQALEFVSFYLQEVQKHKIGLLDSAQSSLQYVVSTLLTMQGDKRAWGRTLQLRTQLYRTALSLLWLDPKVLLHLLEPTNVSIIAFIEMYVDFVTKLPPKSTYDRSIGIVALSHYLRWIYHENQSVNVHLPEVQNHVRVIVAVLRVFLHANAEMHKAGPSQRVSADEADDFPTDDDFETDDESDSDAEGNPRDLDDGEWIGDTADAEDDDEDTANHHIAKTSCAAILRQAIADTPALHAFVQMESISESALDAMIRDEEAFIQRKAE